MGIVQRHALARTVRAVSAQVVFPDDSDIPTRANRFGNPNFTTLAAAGSFRVLEGFTVESAQDRNPRMDARQMRGHRQRLPGRTQTTADFTTYIDLRGAAQPEQHNLLIAALGANSGNNYTPADTPPALDLLFESEGIISEGVWGWGCDTFTIAIPNAEEPTFQFQGPARLNTSAARAAAMTVAGNLVTFADPLAALGFDLNSYVASYAAATGAMNGGPAIVMERAARTGSSNAQSTITVDPTKETGDDIVTLAALDDTDGNIIGPWTPYMETQTQFPADSRPAYTAQAFLTIDGIRFDFQEAEITVNNNLMLKEPASQPILTDFCPNYRDVGGNITFYAGQQELLRKVIAKSFSEPSGFREVVSALVFRLGGNVTGAPQLLITMPRVQFDRGALELAANALGTFTLPFMSLNNIDLTVADNDITLAYGVAV